MVHFVPVVLFGFLQLDPQVQQRQGWNDAQAKTHAPGGSQVIFTEDEDHDHRHKRGDNEANIDGKVCEADKPSVAVASFEFASRFCTGYASGWVPFSELVVHNTSLCYQI